MNFSNSVYFETIDTTANLIESDSFYFLNNEANLQLAYNELKNYVSERKSRTIVQILISNQKTIPNNDDWRFGKRNLETLKICKIKSQANREPSFDVVLNCTPEEIKEKPISLLTEI